MLPGLDVMFIFGSRQVKAKLNPNFANIYNNLTLKDWHFRKIFRASWILKLVASSLQTSSLQSGFRNGSIRLFRVDASKDGLF